jgi:hypothetical protein
MKQVQIGIDHEKRKVYVRVKGADENLMLMSAEQADSVGRLIVEAARILSGKGDQP